MSRQRIARFVSACVLVGALLSQALGQGVGSSTLNISTDAASAAVHAVVHVTASLQTSGSSATGPITFLDGGHAIASVSIDSQGIAVLGVASLSPGNHILSATYAGDSTHTGATSGTLGITIAGLPASAIPAVTPNPVYANQPVTLAAAGLPAAATGSISFLDNSSLFSTAAILGTFTPSYQAFGDGITAGQTVSQAQSYPSLFAAAESFSATNYGVPNSIACDILPAAILANGLGPTQTSSPLSSLMVGSTEMDNYGSPYLPLFNACDQAAIAWLAIPREYKVLPGDPGASIPSAIWTADPNNGALRNTSGAGALTFNLTSNGGPLYLWYLLGDALPGSFTLSVDGVAEAAIYSTQPTPAIGSRNQSPSIGFTLLRIPVSAGPHILTVNVQSGTVGILGVATTPSTGGASVHPTVLVSDIPNQLNSAPISPPALITAYTQAIQSSVSQFQADGLDVRLIPTQTTMQGTPTEMNDPIDPNALGQSHLALAFSNAFGTGPTAPYSTFTGSTPTASVAFTAPGTHSVTAAYSGDLTYASGNSPPLSVTVLPQTASITSLSTRTTSYPSGSPVVLNMTIMPASATGTVTLYDGTGLLTQATLAGGTATFTTTTLALGLHQLSAVYNGDAPDAASASPPLAVEITPGATSLTLTPITATAPYGTLGSLVATLSPASATGAVTLQDQGRGVVGQATIAGGTATLDASSLVVGTHTLTASYSGDSSHLPCTSANLTVTITAALTTTTLVAQPAQIVFGAPESLTATVSPVTAGGSVVFRDSSAGVLGTATVIAGSAILTSSTLPPGLRNISAAYGGDAIHASSLSAITTIAVSVAPSSVLLAPLPASFNAGTPISLTATVTPASATGTLTFQDASGGVLGQATITHGTASLLLSSLPAGTYAITAQYPGDTDDGGSSSAAVLTQVVLQASQATLAAVGSSVPYGTPLALAASVSPVAASGVMSFYDGANALGQAQLVSGQAVFKIATLATGSHQMHVVYGGDGVYAASISPAISASITPASTVTSLSVADVNVPLGGSVVFNVRVNGASGSAPGGIVVIRANGAVLTSGSVANAASGVGYATLSVPSAAVGFGSFGATAYYSGDGNDLPSDTSGAPVSFAVISSATLTSLSLSSTQVPPQSPVTLTASVRNLSAAIATGTMEFSMNGAVLATLPLDTTGSATAKLGAQAVGSYSLSARYIPSGFWVGSVSEPQALTVTLPVALTLTPNTVTLGSGASTTVTLGVMPLSGYSGALQLQCASSAPFVICSIDPLSSLTGPTTSKVHLTVAPNTLGAFLPRTRSRLLQDSGFVALLVPLFLRRRRTTQAGMRSLLALCAIAALLSGCATGGDFGEIPPGRQLMVVSVNAAGTLTTAGIAVQIGP